MLKFLSLFCFAHFDPFFNSFAPFLHLRPLLRPQRLYISLKDGEHHVDSPRWEEPQAES